MVGGVLGGGAVMLVGDRQHNLRLSHQLGDGLVFHGRQRDLQQVPGGGVVVLVMQAVGVDKMGIGTAQLPGGVVHQLHKIFHAARHMDGQGVGGVVAGTDEQIAHQIHKGDLLADQQIAGTTLLIQSVHGIPCDGDHILGIAVFHGHQGGHQLCSGGGIKLHVRILLQQDGIGAQFIQNGTLGGHPVLGSGRGQHGRAAQDRCQRQTEDFFQHFVALPCAFLMFYAIILSKARMDFNKDFPPMARIQNFLRNGAGR